MSNDIPDGLVILDVKGLFCPEPVMMLHNKVDEIDVGDTVQIIATDPSTKRDIPRFCNFLGHELVQQYEEDSCYIYIVRKG
ncbi:MAG: sulfurtransferase TusA [Pseudomonadales bacterium]|uniref:SirA family protein n=1 Tax=Oleiphilus messinensis TaxID=141451 RepID=A0A1Y0I760_9GAMM|nr:sulfurtransferase TusA [Oleiphilus messinensis]ARU56332.1 SirA family protein [Oleiphilus messinensis]MCG8612276.1 sulfurtransferase TusA [Pseudomonadales bacterium]